MIRRSTLKLKEIVVFDHTTTGVGRVAESSPPQTENFEKYLSHRCRGNIKTKFLSILNSLNQFSQIFSYSFWRINCEFSFFSCFQEKILEAKIGLKRYYKILVTDAEKQKFFQVAEKHRKKKTQKEKEKLKLKRTRRKI